MSKPTAPTKVMPWEEFYQKTDNANKLMDRVWYAIACTDENVAKQKIFWEHWYWQEGDAEKELKQRKCCNHTLTIEAVNNKEVDYPIWPVRFSNDPGKEYMKMYIAFDLKCFVVAPFGMNMYPLQFPADDSPEEFRVDYTSVMGTNMYFIFALTPHISEENKKKAYDRLEQENGVKREWFHEIKWDPEYKIGSAGEPDINPKN